MERPPTRLEESPAGGRDTRACSPAPLSDYDAGVVVESAGGGVTSAGEAFTLRK
jgi:hypothetical protein